jgi:ABC-type phosphate/phosphonate transport system substrate-binding protein
VFRIFSHALVLGAITLALASAPAQQPKKNEPLHIGTSGTLSLDASNGKDEVARENMRDFIKGETGFDNDIVHQKDWRELADKLANKQLQLGVFHGYELAWARGKYPQLHPLALASNGYTYRHAYVLTRQDNKAADFAGLRGQALALSNVPQKHLQVFVDRLSQENGKPGETFIARITTPESIEDAIDDVVDGVVQATAVDRVGLEAYKRRKPGRFSRLKVVAQSQAFPPPLVAYYDEALDKPTLDRFRDGLLNASQKEMGQRLLNLFKLTGFEAVPGDFDRVLAQTQKDYPPPKNATK